MTVVIMRNGRMVIMKMDRKLAEQMKSLCSARGETVYMTR